LDGLCTGIFEDTDLSQAVPSAAATDTHPHPVAAAT